MELNLRQIPPFDTCTDANKRLATCVSHCLIRLEYLNGVVRDWYKTQHVTDGADMLSSSSRSHCLYNDVEDVCIVHIGGKNEACFEVKPMIVQNRGDFQSVFATATWVAEDLYGGAGSTDKQHDIQDKNNDDDADRRGYDIRRALYQKNISDTAKTTDHVSMARDSDASNNNARSNNSSNKPRAVLARLAGIRGQQTKSKGMVKTALDKLLDRIPYISYISSSRKGGNIRDTTRGATDLSNNINTSSTALPELSALNRPKRIIYPKIPNKITITGEQGHITDDNIYSDNIYSAGGVKGSINVPFENQIIMCHGQWKQTVSNAELADFITWTGLPGAALEEYNILQSWVVRCYCTHSNNTTSKTTRIR